MNDKDKPQVRLTGTNGDAFAALQRCRITALRNGWSKERWDEFKDRAQANATFAEMLSVISEYFTIT